VWEAFCEKQAAELTELARQAQVATSGAYVQSLICSSWYLK